MHNIIQIMTMKHTYEIMAPVGSREALAAALKAGADSIYFGIEALNMRAHSATHFTIDDLHDIAARCNGKHYYLRQRYRTDAPHLRCCT